MADPRDYDTTVRRVEEIIDIWLEYDKTGDASVFKEGDIFADDVIHNPVGEPPVVGKASVIEYLDEELDPTGVEWTTTIDDLTVGRDLVIARLNYRGTERTEAGDENKVVVGTSTDAFRWQEDGSLKQILSAPAPDG